MKSTISIFLAVSALALSATASEDPTGALEGVKDLSENLCIPLTIKFYAVVIDQVPGADLSLLLQLQTRSTRLSMAASMFS